MNPESYKEAIVRHEVGHWVVAKVLGYSVGDLSFEIKAGPFGMGHSAHAHIDLNPSLSSIEEVDRYLAERMSILMAGVCYQSSVDEREKLEIWKTDAVDDDRKLQELCFALRGVRFHSNTAQENQVEQRCKLLEEAWFRAERMLSDNERSCAAVAAQILKRIREYNCSYLFSRSEIVQWINETGDAAQPSLPADVPASAASPLQPGRG